ncbi:hypothetical protein [Spongiactinospora sp. 9N601]|uniref:hypothetical protein n=1 Tax=Spongiactinospora sp. 9N601 TaxID=3375149 RepID=UPI0037AE0169
MPSDGYVLDTRLLIEAGRGDSDVVALLQVLDAADMTIVVPALAVTGAIVDAATDDQLALMRGIGRLDSATFAGLAEYDDAADLGAMRSEPHGDHELWDVQTVLRAALRGCPILTVDAARAGRPPCGNSRGNSR